MGGMRLLLVDWMQKGLDTMIKWTKRVRSIDVGVICENCVYWFRNDGFKNDTKEGKCKRHPPIPADNEYGHVHPNTGYWDKCGEHEEAGKIR